MRGPSVCFVGLGLALTASAAVAAPSPRFRPVVLAMPEAPGSATPLDGTSGTRAALLDPAGETALGHDPRPPSYDLRLAQRDDGGVRASLKRRFRARDTGIRDAYVAGESGLRVSIGNSYHMGYAGTSRVAGSRPAARRGSSAVNLRDGYEGYAPVAMAGYDRFVSDRMKIGVEGGMMIGRSAAMYADETMPGAGSTERTARNPVADVVMTYAF